MRLVDIESESFLNEMREKQNACKEMIHSSDGATPTWTERDHWEGVYGIFVEMALTLKKQPTVEAVPMRHTKPVMGVSRDQLRNWWQCGNCESVIDKGDRYCRGCGAEVEWDDNN